MCTEFEVNDTYMAKYNLVEGLRRISSETEIGPLPSKPLSFNENERE